MSERNEDRISSLPQELLISIFEMQHGPATLAKLCRVSRLFYRLATPILYTHVPLYCCNDSMPHVSPFGGFGKIWPQIEFGSSIAHIESLSFNTGTLHPHSQCWHRIPEYIKEKYGDARNKDNDTEQDDKQEHQARLDLETEYKCIQHLYDKEFEAFCQRIPENGLHSFNWLLGQCVPSSLLGPGGYLTRYQKSLQNLVLFTNPYCTTHSAKTTKYDLAAFDGLNSFEWSGPQTLDDYIALRDCLWVNAPHLRSLVLDLVDWSLNPGRVFDDAISFHDLEDISNFFTRDILKIDPDDTASTTAIHFPALEHLSLTELNLDDAALEQMSLSLSFSQLTEFELSNCAGMKFLLDHLAKSRRCTQLTSLEICYDECDDANELPDVASFLKTLPLLEDVFLCLPISDWGGIMSSIQDRNLPLKHVVLHKRAFNELTGGIADGSIDYANSLREFLVNNDCSFIGLSCHPDDLQKYMEPDAAQMSCKMLHIRAAYDQEFPGTDKLLEFANWIFGPDGMPELTALAYGDFAFGGNNAAFCRNECTGEEQKTFAREIERSELYDLIAQEGCKGYNLKVCKYRPSFTRVDESDTEV